MVKTLRCPRCGGLLFVDGDVYGPYEECIQCGYIRELIVESPKPLVVDESSEATDWLRL